MLCFTLADWLAVIFTILFLVQCQRESEKEREKETPYSIHISSCLVQEKKREGNCIFNTHFLVQCKRGREEGSSIFNTPFLVQYKRERQEGNSIFNTPFGKLFRIEEPFQISLNQALDSVCVCVCVCVFFSTSCSSCQNVKMCTLL